MSIGNFVAYYRVSTARQGASGLGLEAQRASVEQFLKAGNGFLVGEFLETETGKGKDALAKRPQLSAAMEACRKSGAKLIIAKLDRLARNVHFITGLMEAARNGGNKVVRFVACDMPDANDLTIHVLAAFAEHEAERISQRTKEALARAKARGTVLGAAGAANLKPNLEQRRLDADAFAAKMRGQILGFAMRGLSQREMTNELNALGICTAKGCTWSLVQTQRLIARIANLRQER